MESLESLELVPTSGPESQVGEMIGGPFEESDFDARRFGGHACWRRKLKSSVLQSCRYNQIDI